jgi:dipeptidyl aminopeptidase/acylaminoacyl peptidase
MDRTVSARAVPTMLLTVAMCMPVGAVLGADTRIPIELFAEGDAMARPAISPDGRHLVYITHAKGKPIIASMDLVTKERKGVLSGESGSFDVQWCEFKNDERLLCSFAGVDFAGGRPYGTTRLVAVNVDGSKLKVLLQNHDGGAGLAQFQDRILHWLPDDPRNVIIQLDDDQNIYPSVFKLDVYSGGLRTVQRERPPVVGWMTDRSGTVRFGYGYRSSETAAIYLARTGEDGPWNVIEKFHRYDDQTFSPLGFGVRPNTLFVAAPNDGRSAVWEFDIAETRDVQLVFANPDVDVDDPIIWPSDGHLAGFRYETDRPQAFYIDDLAQRVENTARKLLPDRFSSVIAGSRDGKKLIIAAYSDVKPVAYYLLDIDAGSFKAIGSNNPELDRAALAPMKTIHVPVGDVKVPGYLTVPVGKEPKNLPLIVYPHGGPYARDHWGFDPVLQMMVSRGYAVLQLNFRGSTGYGEQWLDAGWRGWGGIIHDDITAAAHWAINEGIADPKRMCIVGWSYGGYAALLGVAREPDLYKCAVSIAGVSDLNALVAQEKMFYGGSVRARESIGSDKKALRNDSPLKLADHIKVPVLLIHGESDYTVLASHSEAMAKELKRNKVPTELVLIKGGEHDLAREEMRLTLFRKLEKFLGDNLGPT